MTKEIKIEQVVQLLQLPLSESNVAQREGAFGKKLDYLETWFVIQQANDIFGYDGWECETTRLEHIGTTLGTDKSGKERYSVAYRSTVRVTAQIGEEVLRREGSGFGNGMGSELDAHELALKEAESDALKRAFKSFGQQFGLHLYDKDRLKVDTLGDAGFKNFAARNEAVKMVNLIMDNWTPAVCELDELKGYARRLVKSEPMLGDDWKKRFDALEQLEKDFEKDAQTNY